MEAKHKGAHSELAACLWLLEQGYEVFRNVSQHGTTDMIALKHDCTIRVDVKTAQQYTMKDGTVKHYCKHPAVRGVRILAALSNGDFVWADQMPQNRPKVHG